MRREARIEVTYDGEFEDVAMALIRAPRLEANIAKSVDVVKSEYLESGTSS
jgi:hypothetical protein